MKKIAASFTPSKEWGPVDAKIKNEWLEYCKSSPPFSFVPKILRKKKKAPTGKSKDINTDSSLLIFKTIICYSLSHVF